MAKDFNLCQKNISLENIFKNKNIFFHFANILLSVLLTYFPHMAYAGSLPEPITHFVFDVAHGGTSLVQSFQITEYRSYIFALEFDYRDDADRRRVLKLVGDGPLGPNAGLKIPIYLEIDQMDEHENKLQEIFTNTVNTTHSYAHNFFYSGNSGSFSREIAHVFLYPGTYKLEARTVENEEGLLGTPTYLLIDYRSGVKYSPEKN